MKPEECYIGARVICTKPFAGFDKLVGKLGTIVHIYKESSWDIGVEFDEPFEFGHNCNGKCVDRHGRYGNSSSLELIQEITPELTMSYDEVMGW